MFWADPSGADSSTTIMDLFYSAGSGATTYTMGSGNSVTQTGYVGTGETIDPYQGPEQDASQAGGGGGGGIGGFFKRMWQGIFGGGQKSSVAPYDPSTVKVVLNPPSETMTMQNGVKVENSNILGDFKAKNYTATVIGKKNASNVDVAFFAEDYIGTSIEYKVLGMNVISLRDMDGRLKCSLDMNGQSVGVSINREGFFGTHYSATVYDSEKTGQTVGFDISFRPNPKTVAFIGAAAVIIFVPQAIPFVARVAPAMF